MALRKGQGKSKGKQAAPKPSPKCPAPTPSSSDEEERDEVQEAIFDRLAMLEQSAGVQGSMPGDDIF